MAAAEDLARAAGKDSLRLYTNEAMTENLAFYESLGYGVEERRLEDGYRRIFFLKRL
jgi:ribosomal protein S18 acetylase RimI-like enzyme